MSRKWLRKTTASPNAPQSAAAPSIAVLRESEDSHRFSTSAVCHVILHPIALTTWAKEMVGIPASARVAVPPGAWENLLSKLPYILTAVAIGGVLTIQPGLNAEV